MSESGEENKSLKTHQSLQLRYFDIMKQDQQTDHLIQNPKTQQQSTSQKNNDHGGRDREEAELVSLCLGRSTQRDSEAKNNTTESNNNNVQDHQQDRLKAKDLTLGLGNDEIAENSSEDHSKESSEVPKKSMRSNGDNDEASHEQSQAAKRARVSVRARCETPTMNDGCQWRKYGQKIAKGNPCPRAYYRCTVAPSCPVRKQVQRCAEDMSILITTYEGTHNHPLPVNATAMASTTSAAASMLLSGSSTSLDHTNSRFSSMSQNTHIGTSISNGLGFGHHFFDTSSIMRPQHNNFPSNTSSSSYSSSFSPLFPTITLDLTSSQISQSPTPPQPSSSHFISRSSSLPSNFPRISSSSLSFGNNISETSSINLPTLWANGSPYLGYNNPNVGSSNLGRQSQEFLYQRCAEKLMSSSVNNSNINGNNNPAQDSLTETLTKAITADPGAFKSVIAAAISSMVGGGGGTDQTHHHAKQDGQRLTLGRETVSHSIPLTQQHGKGLTSSSFFNGLSSSNFLS